MHYIWWQKNNDKLPLNTIFSKTLPGVVVHSSTSWHESITVGSEVFITVVNPLLQVHVKLPGVFAHVAPKTGQRPLIFDELQYALFRIT